MVISTKVCYGTTIGFAPFVVAPWKLIVVYRMGVDRILIPVY